MTSDAIAVIVAGAISGVCVIIAAWITRSNTNSIGEHSTYLYISSRKMRIIAVEVFFGLGMTFGIIYVCRRLVIAAIGENLTVMIEGYVAMFAAIVMFVTLVLRLISVLREEW